MKSSNRSYLARLLRTFWMSAGFVILLISCTERRGALKPLRTPSTGSGVEFSDQPMLVSFSELQEDPFSFRDKYIRVSGDFVNLDHPECVPYSGPTAQWALISENLRLDAFGFEVVVELLPQNYALTVDGYFRLYDGPLGCGKEPAASTAWSLEVLRLVQPNSIVRAAPLAGSSIPGQATADSMVTSPVDEGPLLTPTNDADSAQEETTAEAPLTMTPSDVTSQITSTPKSTSTGTAQQTASRTPTRPGESSPTPSPSSTFGPGTPTLTHTPTSLPSLTPEPTVTPNQGSPPAPLPTVTETLSGYPPPSVPTATSSYP